MAQDRTRELNRLQKMLEDANIKLSGTVADINGKSARNILDTILSGTGVDSAKYDEMYSKNVIAHNLKASKEQIIDDLNGVMSPLQRKMMREKFFYEKKYCGECEANCRNGCSGVFFEIYFDRLVLHEDKLSFGYKE